MDMNGASHRSYIPRIADDELRRALRRVGAVLIEGPRACGKTETASQAARSEVHVDRDPSVPGLAAIDPMLVLEGPSPRLIDEWQLVPSLWNAVRGAVDERREVGQFILTGSTAPGSDSTRHTGAGRFARLRMHTMTMSEMDKSTAEVSLKEILQGDAPRASDPGMSFKELTEQLVMGGWPGYQGLVAEDISLNLADYLETVAMLDVRAVDGTERDPARVSRLLLALARSAGTEVSISTLARDETSLTRDTVRDYLGALERIFLLDNQPAWSANLRSSATLRKEPKRHFADPSLAAAALGVMPEALQKDPAFTGQLFESLVVHELRAYGAPIRGAVFHARDSAGREVGAIVSLPDGTWAGFEVKLGMTPEIIDGAAHSLLVFAQQVSQQPSALTVVVPSGPSYRRLDGVNVVALAALGV